LHLVGGYIFPIAGLEAMIKMKISTPTGNRSFDPEIKHRLYSPSLLAIPTQMLNLKEAKPQIFTLRGIIKYYVENYTVVCILIKEATVCILTATENYCDRNKHLEHRSVLGCR
jgi:hypothetical protein